MHEALTASIVLVLLVISTAVGIYIRHQLPDRHRSQETVNLESLAISMLVTFAALVMSLLIYSVKGAFDEASKDMGLFAAHIVELDHCLANYGPETAPERNELRFYAAEVIATTWPGEQAPTDAGKLVHLSPIAPGAMESPALSRVLDRINLAIRHLAPADAFQSGLATSCLGDFQSLRQARWMMNESATSTISTPFFTVLVFWLMVIFVTFGLTSPRSLFVFIILTLSAVSISSAIFVMLDMDTPFSGIIIISSQPMRNAYADISLPEYRFP